MSKKTIIGEDGKEYEIKKKGTGRKIIIGIIAFILLGVIISTFNDTTEENTYADANIVNNTNTTNSTSFNNDSNSKTYETSSKPSVPKEYESALKKAEVYVNQLYMSKAGLYDQLTSEYGEKFTPEAAQYAIEHINANWKQNALMKAHTYQDSMNMSPAAIRDQLVSEYGEKFTPEEADWAISNLNK